MEQIETNQPGKKSQFLLVLKTLVVFELLIIVALLFKDAKIEPPAFPTPTPTPKRESIPNLPPTKFQKFASLEDFRAYLEKSKTTSEYSFNRGMGQTDLMPPSNQAIMPKAESGIGGGGEPGRVSETNVQVLGIDEPDIVKTGNKEIYFSSERTYGIMPEPLGERSLPDTKIIPPYPNVGGVKIVQAFPPDSLSKIGNINKNGNLLLYNNKLIIFDQSGIYGYNVETPSSPREKWNLGLKNNSEVVQGRLYNGKLYIVTRSRIDYIRPCPIEPVVLKDIPLSIRCTDIYHPDSVVPSDVTYTVMSINPESGRIDDKVSFLGSYNSSVIYMSQNSLYVAYTFYPDMVDFLYRFFTEKGRDLIPETTLKRLEKLRNYDISSAAKMVEFQNILQELQSQETSDDKLRRENELQNRMEAYYKEQKRTLEKTGIVKIKLDNLAIIATGDIPGRLLNQFSLDESKDFLRVATTVGGTMFNTTESSNDVYVLDYNLKTIGSLIDLGVGERIYSVRFIEDKAYVVTFKQIDPFFVISLKDPQSPKLKGQLKIPGYSSYLHPISGDRILGIGKEGANLKVSLFDVSTPDNPTEVDKYSLDDYHSDILENYHAFLLDKKHQVFFLPGTKGGYVFSYKSDNLKMVKAVSEVQTKRAVYMDDYLYIIGEDQIVVLSENTWQRINQLVL